MAESEPITAFGRFLRDWRWKQEPSWSKRKVALELGVATSTVWNWENSDRLPQEEQLPKIAKMTGRSLKDLYTIAGYPSPQIIRITNPKLIEYMIQAAESDPELEPREREQLLAELHEMQERVAAGGNHDVPELWMRSN